MQADLDNSITRVNAHCCHKKIIALRYKIATIKYTMPALEYIEVGCVFSPISLRTPQYCEAIEILT